MTSTSAGSEDSSACGARWSATTTSACAIARRPRTVISPGSPGPPPTRTTEPRRPPAGVAGRAVGDACRRSAPRRRRPGSPIARCGSPPPCTPTTTSSCRPIAGVQTLEARRSSARAQKMRARSASSPTAAFTAWSSVAATAYQAPSRSPGVVPAAEPGERTGRDQRLERRGDLRADDGHLRPGLQQPGHPAVGDLAAADHDDAPALQPQADRVDHAGPRVGGGARSSADLLGTVPADRNRERLVRPEAAPTIRPGCAPSLRGQPRQSEPGRR